MPRARLALVVLLVAALAGCGSSKHGSAASGPTKAEVLQKGDAICRRVLQQSRAQLTPPNANPASPRPAQLKPIGKYLAAIAAGSKSALSQVKALGTPTTDVAAYRKAMSTGDAIAAAQQAAAQAALSGSLSAYKAQIARFASLGPAAQRASAAFGFKVCGQGGG